MYNINNSGDKTFPCLTPLCIPLILNVRCAIKHNNVVEYTCTLHNYIIVI